MSRRHIIALILLLLALAPQPPPVSAGQPGEGQVYDLGYGLLFNATSGPATHIWPLYQSSLASVDTVDFSAKVSLSGGRLVIELVDKNNNTLGPTATITRASISLGGKSKSILPAREITVHLRYLRSGWAALYLEWDHRVEDMILAKTQPWQAEPASIRVTMSGGIAVLVDPGSSVSLVEPELDENTGHAAPQMIVAAEGFSAELYLLQNKLVTRAPDGRVISTISLSSVGAPLPSYDYQALYRSPVILDARNVQGSRIVLLEASRFNTTNRLWERGLLLCVNGSPAWVDIPGDTVERLRGAWILGPSTLLLYLDGTYYVWRSGSLEQTNILGSIRMVDASKSIAVVLSSPSYEGNTYIVTREGITRLRVNADLASVSGDMVALAREDLLYVYNVSSGEWHNHTLPGFDEITALDADRSRGILAAGYTTTGHAIIAEIRGDNMVLHNETKGEIPAVRWDGQQPSYVVIARNENKLTLQRVINGNRKTVFEVKNPGPHNQIHAEGVDPRIIIVSTRNGTRILVNLEGAIPSSLGRTSPALAALAPTSHGPPTLVIFDRSGLLLVAVSNGSKYTWRLRGLAEPAITSQPYLEGGELTFTYVWRSDESTINYTVARVNVSTGRVSAVNRTLPVEGRVDDIVMGASEIPGKTVLAAYTTSGSGEKDVTYYIIDTGSGEIEWMFRLSSITGPIPGSGRLRHIGVLASSGALVIVAGISSGGNTSSIIARAWENGSFQSTRLEEFLAEQGIMLNTTSLEIDSLRAAIPWRGGKAAILAGLYLRTGDVGAGANLLLGVSPEPWLVDILPDAPARVNASLDGLVVVLGSSGYDHHEQTIFYNGSLARALRVFKAYGYNETIIIGKWIGTNLELHDTESKSWSQALPHPQHLLLINQTGTTSIPYRDTAGRLAVLTLKGWLPTASSTPNATAKEYLFYFDAQNRTAGTICNDQVLTHIQVWGENNTSQLEIQCNGTAHLPEWADELKLNVYILPGGIISGDLESAGERFLIVKPDMLDPANVIPHQAGDRSLISGETICVRNESFGNQIGNGAIQVVIGSITYNWSNCITIQLPPGNYTMITIERSPTGVVGNVWITNLTVLPGTGELETPLPYAAQTPPPTSPSPPPQTSSTASPPSSSTPSSVGPTETTTGPGSGRHIFKILVILLIIILLIIFYIYWTRRTRGP